MLRRSMLTLVCALAFTQLASAQEVVKELKKVVQESAAAAARSVAEQLPAAEPGPCINLDILIACVAFDERGELRVGKEGAEPEVNRAGTIAPNLAAKLNEDRASLPAGVSAGAAGANFLLQGLAGEDKIESLEQFQLRLAANGAKARLQGARREPHIRGTTVRGNNLTNTIDFENVGSLVSAAAHLTESGKITLSIEIEKSSMGPQEEGAPIAVSEGNIVRTPRIDTLMLETETVLANGESTVLSSLVRSSGDKVTETFVVVTATVVER